MIYYPEKQAGKFLLKNGFSILKTYYVPKLEELPNVLEKLKFPVVLKISGSKIVHKGKLGGVKLGIKNIKGAEKAFRDLSKIKGFEGVLIQEQYKRKKEFLLGVKKTSEFGHVIAFGTGGSSVEETGDIYFRVCDFDLGEAEKLIKESKISRGLKKKDYDLLKEALVKMCRIVHNNPKIKELDINPLILGKDSPYVVDSRIFFE
jgi:succinyl-CoA synthetase beta subunit